MTACPTSIAGLPNPLVTCRADPHLSRHDGAYWFTASVPAFDAIELRTAERIEDLRHATSVTIWRRHESGPMSWHIWAPELHRIDGHWLIYFAASERDDIWKLRMYVLENASPDPRQGQWIERGPIATPIDSFALDATRFEHRGTHYLCWAQRDPSIAGNSNLYLAELADASTLAGPPVRLSVPDRPWEQIGFLVNEGPAVLCRHDRVFIAYSASATDHHYCMGLLWAHAGADLLDPASWHKSPQPVFASANGIWGPGHNSFTIAADGRTDLLVFHARSHRDIDGDPLHDPNRHTRVQPFGWTPDGFPDFGDPLPEPVSRP